MMNAVMTGPTSRSHSRSVIASLKGELAHFELCPMCRQAVDIRDIHAVRHHLVVGHNPVPVH